MAEQLAELNKNANSIAWKSLGQTTGTSWLALPSEYNEIYVLLDNQTKLFGVLPSFVTGAMTINGYYATGNFGASGSIIINNGQIRLDQVFLNGSDVTSTTTMSVYYR